MTLIRPSAGISPAVSLRKITAMKTGTGVHTMQLLNEALSRARMRWPQADRTTTSSEATRSARTVAMQARRRAARDLGL